ncbi:hypothetical protein Salat_1128300 [Sesamum alatum]|uniref:Uncharacterized protein n=1 Tax=Sesamum alatum TaxID=300844 RepID=A0AAE1YDT2_9LAMI|nr:hypothetical protein Salat_1128300 [Sesamum alatum]
MPVRYLGIPLAAKWFLVTDFSPLVDRIENCIHKWTAKSLSFAGRLELINSVIQEFSFGTLREYQLFGRKFAIPRKKAVLVSGTFNPGMMPSLPKFYGTFIVRQTSCGYSGSTVSTLEAFQFWTSQPKKGDSPLLQRLADIRNRLVTAFGSSEAAIQHMAGWSNIKGLETSKAYEYFKPNLKGSFGKRQSKRHLSSHSTHSSYGLDYGEDSLHATDLRSYKRKHHARCASTPMNQPNIFSLSVPSVTLFGVISGNGLASTDV